MNIIEAIKAARTAVASGVSVEDAFGSVTSDIRVYRQMIRAFRYIVYTDFTMFYGHREMTHAEVVDCVDRTIMHLANARPGAEPFTSRF